MKIVATTSLPAVDRPNADRWNAARSRQNVKKYYRVPVNKEVRVNKEVLTGKVPVNKELLTKLFHLDFNFPCSVIII